MSIKYTKNQENSPQILLLHITAGILCTAFRLLSWPSLCRYSEVVENVELSKVERCVTRSLVTAFLTRLGWLHGKHAERFSQLTEGSLNAMINKLLRHILLVGCVFSLFMIIDSIAVASLDFLF